MDLTLAQRVNRYIEQEFTGPCQWASFPHRTVVLLSPPELLPQTHLASRARDILQGYGIERDTFDGIKPLQDGGYLVEYSSKFDLPRGVCFLGVCSSLQARTCSRAVEDIGLDPFVVNCKPGEIDEESDDEYSDMSDGTPPWRLLDEHARGFAILETSELAERYEK